MKSCIILCGGKGRRIGGDKGLIIFKNMPMILHVLNAAEDIADEIIIILQDEIQVQNYKEILHDKLDKKNGFLRLYTDTIKDQGPLVGILTGLLKINSKYALVLPCDSPFISKSFILKMFKLAEEDKEYNFDAIVPCWDKNHLEPLHSLYKKDVIDKIEKLLNMEIKDAKSLIKSLNVKYVPVEILDKTNQSFKNINTMKDYKEYNI